MRPATAMQSARLSPAPRVSFALLQCDRCWCLTKRNIVVAGFGAPHRSPSMKKLVLETTAPFQGLPELVAYDEGLFAREGLAIEWADREKDVEKRTEVNVISPKGLDPFSSHGKLLEQGQADMYNACEWGNYCRVQDTKQ